MYEPVASRHICESVASCHVYKSVASFTYFRSRRRPYFKYLDLQIGQFSCLLFCVTGNLVHSREFFLKFWGLPWISVWKLRGVPRKCVWKFGSRKYFKSDLLRLWTITNVVPHSGDYRDEWMSHVTYMDQSRDVTCMIQWRQLCDSRNEWHASCTRVI